MCTSSLLYIVSFSSIYPQNMIFYQLIFLFILFQSCEQICRVWLDQVANCHVNTKYSHALCGHFVNKTPSGVMVCSFCHYNCDAEVTRTFHLKITLADESAKVFAWCTGQTAAELLQISPDEFYELPEVITEIMTLNNSNW